MICTNFWNLPDKHRQPVFLICCICDCMGPCHCWCRMDVLERKIGKKTKVKFHVTCQNKLTQTASVIRSTQIASVIRLTQIASVSLICYLVQIFKYSQLQNLLMQVQVVTVQAINALKGTLKGHYGDIKGTLRGY